MTVIEATEPAELPGEADCKNLAVQLDQFEAKSERLINEINIRHNNIGQNFDRLKKLSTETIPQLQKKYNDLIGKGEGVTAEKILPKLRSAYKEVLNMARNFLGESDIGDLAERNNELHREACNLYNLANENFAQARKLLQMASRYLAGSSQSSAKILGEIEKLLSESKKQAEEILSKHG